MSEVRFHRELYAGAALERAIELLRSHAEITRTDDGDHVVVRIESPKAGRAQRVARELGNFALGLTIQSRGGAAAVGTR